MFIKSREQIFDNGVWVPTDKLRNWFIYVAAYGVRPLAKILFRYKVKGAENLELIKDEPVVIVSNHMSYMDPVIMWCSLYSKGVHLRILARESLFKPIFGGLLARCGAIPIEPDSADRTAIKRAAACLKRGENLLIYPEGTRMNKPSKVYHPHAGAILIANMGKARILPVGVEGPEKIMPYGKIKIPRFVKCFVNIGKPIDPRGEQWEDLPKKGRSEVIIEDIMQEVFRLRDEAAD